jgi:hypothetical protein
MDLWVSIVFNRIWFSILNYHSDSDLLISREQGRVRSRGGDRHKSREKAKGREIEIVRKRQRSK